MRPALSIMLYAWHPCRTFPVSEAPSKTADLCCRARIERPDLVGPSPLCSSLPRRGTPLNDTASDGSIVSPNIAHHSVPDLSVIGIGKSYGDRIVLQDISLNVSHGEVVGILGTNGARSAICFYAVIAIISVDQGCILLGSTDVTDVTDLIDLTTPDRANLGLGYLPQEASIFRGMTVAENITAVLELVEDAPEQRRVALEGLLHEFRLEHVRDTSAIALSGGERRRCEIARAVAADIFVSRSNFTDHPATRDV